MDFIIEIQNKQRDICKGILNSFIDLDIEKAALDKTKLKEKVITDKLGRRVTKWVKSDGDEHRKTTEYHKENLEDIWGLPKELKDEIRSWSKVSKSPYSDSFYNTQTKGWDYTKGGTIRIADHWNFYSKGEKHCKTDKPVENNKQWAMGIYDSKKDLYKIVKLLPVDSEDLRKKKEASDISLKERIEKDRELQAQKKLTEDKDREDRLFEIRQSKEKMIYQGDSLIDSLKKEGFKEENSLDNVKQNDYVTIDKKINIGDRDVSMKEVYRVVGFRFAKSGLKIIQLEQETPVVYRGQTKEVSVNEKRTAYIK